ncbi:hypothetical protein BDW71DRAFT_114155 [Aspergillus fruticulosus]
MEKGTDTVRSLVLTDSQLSDYNPTHDRSAKPPMELFVEDKMIIKELIHEIPAYMKISPVPAEDRLTKKFQSHLQHDLAFLAVRHTNLVENSPHLSRTC